MRTSLAYEFSTHGTQSMPHKKVHCYNDHHIYYLLENLAERMNKTQIRVVQVFLLLKLQMDILEENEK